jgi:hypothetical protein
MSINVSSTNLGTSAYSNSYVTAAANDIQWTQSGTAVYNMPINGIIVEAGETAGGQGFSTVSVPLNATRSKEPVEIAAGLYFRYVKKKFNKIQQQELDARLKKLVNLRVQAQTIDQQGLLEAVEEMLLTAAREQALLIKKMDKFVLKEHIEKFRNKTKNIYMNSLDKFPRPIPSAVQKKILAAKGLQVFDDYQVLYTNYTVAPVAKSSSDKIREKDPIVFGIMSGAPDRLYYIADWVDEYCHLTLNKLVETFKPEGENLVKELEDIKTPEALQALTKRVQNRMDKLNKTTRENWRDLERRSVVEEAAPKVEAVKVEPPAPRVINEAGTVKKRWFSGLFGKS